MVFPVVYTIASLVYTLTSRVRWYQGWISGMLEVFCSSIRMMVLGIPLNTSPEVKTNKKLTRLFQSPLGEDRLLPKYLSGDLAFDFLCRQGHPHAANQSWEWSYLNRLEDGGTGTPM